MIKYLINEKSAIPQSLPIFSDYFFIRTKSTDYVHFYKGSSKRSHSDFSEIEIRVPAASNTALQEIFIRMELSNSNEMNRKMIRSQFGDDIEVVVSPPSEKKVSMVYWALNLKEARVSFGFPHGTKEGIKNVIVKYKAN